MSIKEGRRTPTPTDVVETTPDRKRLGSKSRLLAPILLGIALTLGGGERNGADALANDQRSETTHLLENADFPQRIGDFEIFAPAVDPKTGKPLADQSWIDGVMRSQDHHSIHSTEDEFTDPADLPQIELTPEVAKLVKEIEDITGINYIFPVNPSLVPTGMSKWGITTNFAPSVEQMENLLATVRRLPKQWLETKNGKRNAVTLAFVAMGPSLGNGGLNGMVATKVNGNIENVFASSVMLQSDVDPKLPVQRKLIKLHGEILMWVLTHENHGHMFQRNIDPFFERFGKETGATLDSDGLYRYYPPYQNEDLHGKGTVVESIASWAAFIGPVNPRMLIEMRQVAPLSALMVARESLRPDGVIPRDWEVLKNDPEVWQCFQEMIVELGGAQNYPTPSPTPSPTKPTPETFTVFLPISHSGERINATPEPEERFGRGSNLSDARRFNPSYENRRNNRKGR